MDNQRTNEEYMLASERIANAQAWMDYANEWWDAAYEEVEDSWEHVLDIEEEWEEAVETFDSVDYDPDFEYVDYTEWEVPDNFDMYFDYGMEDCDEDAATEYCDEECDDDADLAWCDDSDADDSADDSADDCTDDIALLDFSVCPGVTPQFCRDEVFNYCVASGADGLGGDSA